MKCTLALGLVGAIAMGGCQGSKSTPVGTSEPDLLAFETYTPGVQYSLPIRCYPDHVGIVVSPLGESRLHFRGGEPCNPGDSIVVTAFRTTPPGTRILQYVGKDAYSISFRDYATGHGALQGILEASFDSGTGRGRIVVGGVGGGVFSFTANTNGTLVDRDQFGDGFPRPNDETSIVAYDRATGVTGFINESSILRR